MNKQDFINNINPLFLKGVAHRGLHNKEDIPENSLAAFKNAIEHNVAFEFDVHLSLDGHLVVFHDDDLKRMTGQDGVIEELTLDELEEYRLPNGENLPLLEDVLKLNNERVPIVLELKVLEKNFVPLQNAVKKVLDKYVKDKQNYMIISFDPRSLKIFKGEYMRSLLITESHKWTFMLRKSVESLDVDKKLFKYKKYKKYGMNHFMNVWTIEKEEDVKSLLPYIDTMTFQHMEVEKVQELLQK